MWQSVLDLLRLEIDLVYFQPYILPLKLVKNTATTIILECPSKTIKSKIEKQFLKLIHEKVQAITGKSFKITLSISSNPNSSQSQPIIDFSTNPYNENSIIEAELSEKYIFRNDIIYDCIEFKEKNSPSDFKPLNQKAFNDIYRGLLKNPKFKNVRTQTVSISLNSSFVKDYNPLTDYIQSLKGKWKRGDKNHLAELMSCFKYSNTLDAEHYFNKFYRRVLHCAFTPSFTNEHCFLLHSDIQGMGKTTFWDFLLPENLRTRFYNSSKFFDFRSRDSLVLASQVLLWNMDELEGIMKTTADAEELRAFMSNSGAITRRAYGKSNERFNKLASFIATGNNPEPLLDKTGNRRFIPLTVIEKLNFNKYRSINKELLLAQVYNQYLVTKAEDLHWTKKEQEEIILNSENYERHFDEYSLLLKHFQPCNHVESTYTSWLTSSEVMEFLSMTHPKIYFNSIGIGRALTKGGFLKNRNTGFKTYLLQLKSSKAKDFFQSDKSD